MENNLRCAIYARFSSRNQTEQSIEGQLNDCNAYADKNGLTVVSTYIDRAFTATSDKRPDFQRMIKDSAKGVFDVVLVWKLDRFARNRYDSATYKNKLKKNGVKVISVMENISDSPEGVLMESILEGYAEYFSKDLAQKTLRGLRESAKKHRVIGPIPFGYKNDNGTYAVDEHNAQGVKAMFEMYVNGVKHADIAEYLNSHGYKTATGNRFTKNSITMLVKNPRYTGKYTYDTIAIEDEKQRIISDELFEKCNEIRKKNMRCAAVRKSKTTYLLSTKIFCGKCKTMMHGESGYGENGIYITITNALTVKNTVLLHVIKKASEKML